MQVQSVSVARRRRCCHSNAGASSCTLRVHGAYDGKLYCVFHYPSKDKQPAFLSALRKKLSTGDWNFDGVWFCSDPGFFRLKISTKASFRHAMFAEDVDFSNTEFLESVDF